MFMLDIETTGLAKTKETKILEIALLELTFQNGRYAPGKSFDLILPTDLTWPNDFHKENMSWLYEESNRLFTISDGVGLSPGQVRAQILSFFKSCGITDPSKEVTIAAWNGSRFDLVLLDLHEYLKADVDYFYRVYEMSGCNLLMMDATKTPANERERLLKEAETADYCNNVKLPEKNPYDPEKNRLSHWGLYDCYRQAKILNGYIHMIYEGVAPRKANQ